MKKSERRSAGEHLGQGVQRFNILEFLLNNKNAKTSDVLFEIQKLTKVKVSGKIREHLNNLEEGGLIECSKKSGYNNEYSLKTDINSFIEIGLLCSRFGKNNIFIKSKYFEENFEKLLPKFMKNSFNIEVNGIDEKEYDLMKHIFSHSSTAFMFLIYGKKITEINEKAINVKSSNLSYIKKNISEFEESLASNLKKYKHPELMIFLLGCNLIDDYGNKLLTANSEVKQ